MVVSTLPVTVIEADTSPSTASEAVAPGSVKELSCVIFIAPPAVRLTVGGVVSPAGGPGGGVGGGVPPVSPGGGVAVGGGVGGGGVVGGVELADGVLVA